MNVAPRRWWPGPLDVEALAWGAVDAARGSVQRLASARGQACRLATSSALVAASFAAIEHLRVAGREPQVWAPMSGFVATRDGWVRLHANYPHHAAAITRAIGATDRPGLERRLSSYDADDAADAITSAGGIAVRVRTPAQWAAHPHGGATAADPWVSTETLGERARPTGGPWPLSGVRVLDLTRVIAGPSATQLLACLGAQVVRLDPLHRPELLDQYLSTGLGKRSATFDLGADAADAAVVESLLARADVLVLGYRPGSLARFGLDPDDVVRRHPHLVVGSLSAWGERGPWAARAGFDSIVQAACGIATTYADGPVTGPGAATPGALPVQALDHASGYVLAAHLVDLLTQGTSGVVRVSLLGAARTLLSMGTPPAVDPVPLPVPTVAVDSPYGPLTVVPPPLTLDGATLERPLTTYGGAAPTWAD